MRVAAALLEQLSHREVLEDALLRFLEPVVPRVERGLHLLERDVLVARARVPRQREHPLDVVPQHLVFARRRRERAQPLRLAPRFLRDALREVGRVDLAQELLRVALRRVALAQLGANRLQLLPEIELAMVLLDLHLRLLPDLLEHRRAGDFLLPSKGDELEPRGDVEPLQHFVALGDAQVAVRRGEIGESRRVRGHAAQQPGHLGGELFVALHERLGRDDDAVHERAGRITRRGDLLGALDQRDGEGDAFRQRADAHAREAFERHLDRLGARAAAILHAREHAHAAFEARRILRVVAERDGDEHQRAGLGMRAQEREVVGGAHLHGDGAVGERRSSSGAPGAAARTATGARSRCSKVVSREPIDQRAKLAQQRVKP